MPIASLVGLNHEMGSGSITANWIDFPFPISLLLAEHKSGKSQFYALHKSSRLRDALSLAILNGITMSPSERGTEFRLRIGRPSC